MTTGEPRQDAYETTRLRSDLYGKITEEGLADLQKRIGSYYRGGSSFVVLTPDMIKGYTMSMGNRDPLYLDEEYARRTRYGGLIAFPTMLNSFRHTSGTPVGGLPGVQSYHSGNDWEFFHVVRPGERVGTTYRPYAIVEKPSSYAGRMVIVYAQIMYVNERGQMVGRAKGWSIRTEREQARERGKYGGVERPKYTLEQLAEIERLIDREEVRGATPRYWEDVKVGEELPTVVKGPLRQWDISIHGTLGGGGRGGGAHANYFMRFYRDHPGMPTEVDPATGVLDDPHRFHHEDRYAGRVAIPGAADYGPQRVSWLGHVATNWMGDDGFLRRLYGEIRRFNVEGDTSFIKGKVTRKWTEGRQHLVECEVWCQNQRDEVTAPGRAEVVLPSRYPGYEVPL